MKTFYRPEMSVEGMGCYSPAAGKPKALIEYLKSLNIKLDINDEWQAIKKEHLCFVHDPFFINDIFDLRKENGFGNKDESVVKSLLYTNGSFVNATIYALNHQENTFSPTSGFHHATFYQPGGFCTFNGLMLASVLVKKLCLVSKIGIIDCDEHHGNGTVDIMSKLGLNFIKHYSYAHQGVQKNFGSLWLKKFESDLSEYKDCDVVFYQAGADPHIDDPLGGSLTSEDLRIRDEILFSKMKEFKIPVVWNLAGGYQRPLEKVLEIHKTTYEVALKEFKR